MIKVITYNAIHRKTQDLLIQLKLKGYQDVTVFATPWEDRVNFKPLIPHRNFKPYNFLTKDICNRLGFKYNNIKSLDELNISDYTLIAGSGIIPKKLTDSKKIINSHPAYLPYTRGLDSLKWAIFNNQPIGVTTHIISQEVDTGWLIKKQLLPLYQWDTFHSVAYRQYQMEIEMLVDAIEDVKKSILEPISNEYCEPKRRMPHKYEIKIKEKLDKIIKNKNV